MRRNNLIKFRVLVLRKSQNEMAELLGISKHHYQALEHGRFNPSYRLMARFANLAREANLPADMPTQEEVDESESDSDTRPNRVDVWRIFDYGKKIKVKFEPIFIQYIDVDTDWSKNDSSKR